MKATKICNPADFLQQTFPGLLPSGAHFVRQKSAILQIF
jgi:hypothetical protein